MKRIENNPSKDENEMSILEKLLKKDKAVALAMVTDMLLAGVDTVNKIFLFLKNFKQFLCTKHFRQVEL